MRGSRRIIGEDGERLDIGSEHKDHKADVESKKGDHLLEGGLRESYPKGSMYMEL